MKTILIALSLLGVVSAQDAPPPQEQNGGWRRVGDPPPNQAPADLPNYPVPAQLILKSGTYLTVRINQPLSSDRNQPGDAFSATLEQPVVIDGIVVAQRGQVLNGRVAEAKKAGRVEGTSRLGVELTDLVLVDGQNLPIHSQLISRNGRTSEGRDAAAVAGTTALGAAIGAGVGWGQGAAIGAGSGAAVGLLGVLLTRGHPTYIGPESVLTFRVEEPVNISTERAPQAFRTVQPEDYQAPANFEARGPRPYGPRPYGPPPPPPYYYGYGYPYYPYYYGPSFGVFYGPSFYYRGGFYRRGFHR